MSAAGTVAMSDEDAIAADPEAAAVAGRVEVAALPCAAG
jgi:hypothetical protein